MNLAIHRHALKTRMKALEKSKVLPLVMFAILLLGHQFLYYPNILIPMFKSNKKKAIIVVILYYIPQVMMLWAFFVCFIKGPGYPTKTIEIGPNTIIKELERGKSFESNSLLGEVSDVPLAHLNTAARSRTNSPHKDRESDLFVEESSARLMQHNNAQSSVILCGTCNTVKHERTHHCSKCNRCVLRMDHHCPWIGNCVGFRNQKAFIVFILWAALIPFVILITVVDKFVEIYSHPTKVVDYSLPILIFGLVASLNFTLTLLGFAGYNIYLVLCNLTTLESMNVSLTPRCCKRKDSFISSDKINIYDIGYRKNFLEIFGDNWVHWLLPTFTSKGDGTEFPKLTRIQEPYA